jgi:hypothetical protein
MKSVIKKIIYLIVISASVIALVAFFFWFKQYQKSGYQLSDYVPSEAIVYTEINLASAEFNNYISDNSQAKEYIEEFILKHDMPSNIWRGEVSIDKVGLVVYLDRNSVEQKAWLISGSDDIISLEATEIPNYYYAQINESTAVVSRSIELMQKIRDHRVVKKIEGDKLKRGDTYFAYGFIKAEKGNSELSKLLGLDNMFDEYSLFDERKKIYWQMEFDDTGRPRASIKMPLQKDSGIVKEGKGNSRYMKINNTIFFNNIKLENVIGVLKEKFEKDSNLEWDSFTQHFQSKYNTSLDELYTIFEQPVYLVLKPKRQLIDTAEMFDFEKYYWALVWDDGSGSKNNLFFNDTKLFIQNYLAYKFPEKQIKYLPDDSFGYELVANLDKYNWQIKNVENRSYGVIEYKDSKIITYEGALVKILSSSELLVNEIAKDEFIDRDSQGQFAWIDTDIVDNSFLNVVRSLFIESEQSSRELKFEILFE